MCCLFGLMDCRNSLTAGQKNGLLSALAAASEARGTDATGIAYNYRGKLRIYKRPWPGHCMRFRVPAESSVMLGHTRMATQGDCGRNCNNHPFPGRTKGGSFALTHNGVLHNDWTLRRMLGLPGTRIETDSYIAVQLIEREKALTLDSLKAMAEQVRGSFTFAVLDERDALYFVKGDNPLCLYHYPKRGLYVYASTEDILKKALSWSGLWLGNPKRVTLSYGDILQIEPSGDMNWRKFQNPEGWEFEYLPLRRRALFWPETEEDSHLNAIKSVAASFGLTSEDIENLARKGFSPEEIEEALYSGEL